MTNSIFLIFKIFNSLEIISESAIKWSLLRENYHFCQQETDFEQNIKILEEDNVIHFAHPFNHLAVWIRAPLPSPKDLLSHLSALA